MRFSLLPKVDIFYQLLNSLANHAEEAAKLFKELLDSWSPQHPSLARIQDLEHICDQIVHEIMVKLNQTFITPIDREDIIHLTKKLDDLVDLIQALSKRLVLFQIKKVTDDLKTMATILERAISLLVTILPKIQNLKDSNKILELCAQVNQLENEGDRTYEHALGTLFLKETQPIEILKWKEIYDFAEKGIDACEDVSDVIWGIVIKYG